MTLRTAQIHVVPASYGENSCYVYWTLTDPSSVTRKKSVFPERRYTEGHKNLLVKYTHCSTVSWYHDK